MSLQYDKYAVGRVIRSVRQERGLTQEVLSGLANIGTTHLSMIENGRKQANLETFWKIANALEMNPNELIALVEKEIRK